MSWRSLGQEASVEITATVPDHGQGYTRESAEKYIKNLQSGTGQTEKDNGLTLLSTTTVSGALLDMAFGSKESWGVASGTRALLVPHHLVAARGIASLVSAVPKPSKVILLVPDHFGACKSGICYTDHLMPLISQRPRYPILTAKQIQGEHAITGLMPFLRRAWGNDVKVTAVMVSPGLKTDEALALSGIVSQALTDDPKALLVASIDASHYLSAEVADFHDILTQDIIASLADMEAGRAEIDAPSVLRVTLRTARDLGLGNVTVHAHTNSLRLMQSQFSQESTSHFLASFAPGETKKQSEVTLLFLGDMMFDRNVAARSRAAKATDYPFQNIMGKEARFFRGQDAVIGNLEGPVTDRRLPPDKGNVDFMFNRNILAMLKKVGIDAVSQANNHTLDQGRKAADQSRQQIRTAGISVFGDQVKDDAASALTIIERRGQKIALVGFNVTDNPLDKEAASLALASAKKQVDHTVVFMHWGAEYKDKPNQDQVALAHWLIDQGADAVIGSHPHWMQSVEVYKDRPIAYSLGNFIFDQDWSAETGLGLAVGLDLNERGSALYLYPIRIEQSQPRLLTGQERKARLDKLAQISDISLSSAIKSGVIKTNQ